MARTSSYTIYVDLPGGSEDMLLVHGYTGAYDKVSRRVATFVRSLDQDRPPRPVYGEWSPEAPVEGRVVPPSAETLERLKRRGYLTEKTAEEEENLFRRMVQFRHTLSERGTPGYIFIPSYDCNLRCSYCFQDHMRTNPAFAHLLRTMKPPMVDRIFAAIPQIEARHGVSEGQKVRRRTTFFGGEPLARTNRDVVGHIMERMLALGPAEFAAVTNGTELEFFRDMIGPGRISFLQITLDGPRAAHDKRRVYADGRGSFGVIAPNIDLALDLGARVGLRMNVDRTSLVELPELAEQIIGFGWDRHPLFSANTAPVHAVNGKTAPKSFLSSWELDLALNEMRERNPRMRLIRRPDDTLMGRVRRIFDQCADPAPSFRTSFCGSQNRMYIFDAFGDIYACWERTGDPSIRIGQIDEGGVVTMNEPLTQVWRSRTVASNPVCLKCRYATYCGGGCAVLAEGTSGKLHTNFCDGFAKRFRASTAEAYLDHQRGAKRAVHELACDQ